MTALLQTDGTACDINPLEVGALLTAPPSYLPVGLPAATIVMLDGKPDVIVQGTVAAVAAALAIPTGGALGGPSFVFRPTAVDSPSTGVFGTWASLLVAVAALVAAAAPFEIFVDLTLLGASYLVPLPTNLGGRCKLRATPSAFSLQCTSAAPLSGINAVEGLTIEVPALGGITGAFLIPPGFYLLSLRGGARLISMNAAGPVIQVGVGDNLLVAMFEGSTLDFGAFSAIDVAGAGAQLAVLIGDGDAVQSGSISGPGGAAVSLAKTTAAAKLPAALANYVGYAGGGVGNVAIVINAPAPVVHGAGYGAAGLPVGAGAYFLPYGGNAAIALAAVGDSPMVQPQQGAGPRVLTGALISADVDGTDGVNPSTVEVLVNGVLVPGMTASPATLMQLATTPIQLVPLQGALLLAPGDLVSVRITLGAAGIVLSPTNPRAILLAA